MNDFVSFQYSPRLRNIVNSTVAWAFSLPSNNNIILVDFSNSMKYSFITEKKTSFKLVLFGFLLHIELELLLLFLVIPLLDLNLLTPGSYYSQAFRCDTSTVFGGIWISILAFLMGFLRLRKKRFAEEARPFFPILVLVRTFCGISKFSLWYL